MLLLILLWKSSIISGLRDFGSTPKGKSGLIKESYYLGAILIAPSIAIINAADKGYGW